MIQREKLKRKIRIVSRKARKAAKKTKNQSRSQKMKKLAKKTKTKHCERNVKLSQGRDAIFCVSKGFYFQRRTEKDCLTQSYAKTQRNTSERK